MPNINFMNSIWRVALIGLFTLSGCSSERAIEQVPRPPAGSQNASSVEPTHKEVGEASWYGSKFHGRETASGETYDQHALTAAHPTLPMGTKAAVTNLENGKKVDVTINDRGPYADGRAIDLSSAAASKLDMKKDGTAQVNIVTKSPKKRKHVSPAHAKRRIAVRH